MDDKSQVALLPVACRRGMNGMIRCFLTKSPGSRARARLGLQHPELSPKPVGAVYGPSSAWASSARQPGLEGFEFWSGFESPT